MARGDSEAPRLRASEQEREKMWNERMEELSKKERMLARREEELIERTRSKERELSRRERKVARREEAQRSVGGGAT